jgi:hypothetical protein
MEAVDHANPNHKIRLFKMKTRERFLTPEERRHVEETLLRGLQIPPGRKGHLDRMGVWALQLLSLTGLRRDEILTLTWPMVDWQHGCLNLPDTKTGQRNVPVPSQVMTLLKRIHDHTGNRKDGLVVRSRTGRKLSGLNLTWKNIREAVGIPDVRLHDLRHSFASDALMGGVPLAIVGEMLGHRQPSTTKRYAHLANRVVREALEHTAGIIVAATNTMPRAAGGAVRAAARRPVGGDRHPRGRGPPARRQARRPAAGGRRHPLGAAHAGALVGHPGELRGLHDVLALVQALVRGRDLAEGRGPDRGAGGHVRASADAAGAAPDAEPARPRRSRGSAAGRRRPASGMRARRPPLHPPRRSRPLSKSAGLLWGTAAAGRYPANWRATPSRPLATPPPLRPARRRYAPDVV